MSTHRLLIMILFLATALPSFTTEKVCVDQIKAIVFADNMTCITQSDIERPGLDGQTRTINDLFTEQLIFQDSKLYNSRSDDDAIDKYLSMVQREHNLTLDQVKDMFSSAGYTFEEGKQQLNMLQSVNQMLDFKIRSHLIVPEREITKYYAEHKDEARIPAQYCLERALIPFADNKMEQEKKLQAFAHGKAKIADIVWAEPFWINVTDLAEDKKFITAMAVGSLSAPIETAEGFELFRLKDKKEAQDRELDDTLRAEITNILRRPRFDQLFTEYKQSLIDKVAIVYL